MLHVTGDSAYAAALAERERLPVELRDRYRPFPFLREDMLAALVATDLVVGRAGSSTLAEVTALGIPSVIVPYPHAGAHQGANAATLAAAGAARVVPDEAFDADALVAATDLLFDDAARSAMAAAARGLGRPGAADAVAALTLALAARQPLPPVEPDRGDRAGHGRVTGPAGSDAAAFDALAVGTAIQRRIGVKTSRDEPLARFTTMRVGGPADLFATVHNVHELRAIVRFARSRGIPLTLLGRGSDVVIADAGIRGLVVQNRAEGSRVDGDRYVAESGVPMARAATEAQKAGLTGLEFGLAIPGTVGGAVWANAGAHESDVAAILESAAGPAGRRHGGAPDRGGPRLPVPRQPPEARRRRSSSLPTFRLAPADPAVIAGRLDEIRRWRREHQPLGIPSAGSTFRNPPGDSAGRLIDSIGWKGRTARRRDGLREARELRRERPEGHRRRRPRPGRRGRRRRRAGDRDPPRGGGRVPRRLAGSGRRVKATRRLPHPPIVVLLGGPSAEHDVSIVSGTAIADALRERGDDVREVLIDLDGQLVVAARRPSPRRPAAVGLRRSGDRSAARAR